MIISCFCLKISANVQIFRKEKKRQIVPSAERFHETLTTVDRLTHECHVASAGSSSKKRLRDAGQTRALVPDRCVEMF